jgi:hypothetical protein
MDVAAGGISDEANLAKDRLPELRALAFDGAGHDDTLLVVRSGHLRSGVY